MRISRSRTILVDGGKAGVGALVRMDDRVMMQEGLTKLGIATSSHDVVDEAALQAAAWEPSA